MKSSEGIKSEMTAERLSLLYKKIYGETPEVIKLDGAGSDRIYYRLLSERASVIGTYGKDIAENEAFMTLSGVFGSYNIHVPKIISVSADRNFYLQEDLGSESLLSKLNTSERESLSRRSLHELARMQFVPEDAWRSEVMYSPFSTRLVKWDLNYFKYCFLKLSGIVFDEDDLENDFERFAEEVSGDNINGFMYRDFQSRNVMVKDGEPWLIDFQGGRLGPVVYDAVSFLWQAKASFTEEERRLLLEDYSAYAARLSGRKVEEILSEVDKFAVLRTMQVLGAYGFRGLIEKKSHFIESIPSAIKNLEDLEKRGALRHYPELGRLAKALTESRFMKKETQEGLTLDVSSFSYKKGYPENLTGNGGGFMFDCRGMHNPGRYEKYKPLTGLDRPVIDFLEEKGEAGEFVEKCLDVVSPAIECYLKRGFENLQVGFGCTGGRHRSVYCAERFALKMKERFPSVNIIVNHREQGIKKFVKKMN